MKTLVVPAFFNQNNIKIVSSNDSGVDKDNKVNDYSNYTLLGSERKLNVLSDTVPTSLDAKISLPPLYC